MPEKKKLIRKVISKEEKKEVETETKTALRSKRGCYFCQSKTVPVYTDLVTLKRFLSDRSKIVPKLRSSVCARHQRAVTKNIKYARHLSLLPFVPKV